MKSSSSCSLVMTLQCSKLQLTGLQGCSACTLLSMHAILNVISSLSNFSCTAIYAAPKGDQSKSDSTMARHRSVSRLDQAGSVCSGKQQQNSSPNNACRIAFTNESIHMSMYLLNELILTKTTCNHSLLSTPNQNCPTASRTHVANQRNPTGRMA